MNGPDLRCRECGHTTTYGDAAIADKHGCPEDPHDGWHNWEEMD